ncbi:MAG: hypothetical protein CM15mP120_00650 [Pseudomonadota bacterium]|nr:MAG: hypothetical protein CM15mP120_00650 [Pseudomonadota bacterium]
MANKAKQERSLGRIVMQTRPMSAPLGLIVEDLDVRSVDRETWRQLNDLFCKHHVLVFPNQG